MSAVKGERNGGDMWKGTLFWYMAGVVLLEGHALCWRRYPWWIVTHSGAGTPLRICGLWRTHTRTRTPLKDYRLGRTCARARTHKGTAGCEGHMLEQWSNKKWGAVGEKRDARSSQKKLLHADLWPPELLLPHWRNWDRLSVTHSENKGSWD